MGVDLYVITGHQLSYEEIIALQDIIESDEKLKRLWPWPHPIKEERKRWSDLMNPERLHSFWKHNEEQLEVDEVFLYDYLALPTFWGEITFHRNIVELEGFGMKLWTLEYEPEAILEFNRRLATLLNQNKVIYYGDSWAKSSWIHGWQFGKTIEEVVSEIHSRGLGQIKDTNQSVAEEHLYIDNFLPESK